MSGGGPFRAGSLLAIGAAVAFGATAPLVQRFGRGLGPFTIGGLLYLGAVLQSLVPSRRARDAAPRLADLPRIALAALAGAFAAPALLAFGLARASGTAASLMLNLEALFTALLAWLVIGESIGRRAGLGLAAMVTASAVLALGNGFSGHAPLVGLLAVGAATLAWSIDNVTLRPLAELDPGRVVLLKAGLGTLASFAAAFARHEPAPQPTATAWLVLSGATGYGLSLRVYLLAQRRIGAARTGSLFALAPFLGAGFAALLGQGQLGTGWLLAAALFALGAFLHAAEGHAHFHTHETLEHAHTHRHDDGHHTHRHEPPVLGEHSHRHHHDRVTHEHPHASDVHHTHRHS